MTGMMTMMISFIVTTEQTGAISELTQWKVIRA